MKIIVLHGDDERKLYSRLQKFIGSARQRGWEVTYLDDPSKSFQEQLCSSSLFGKESFFIVKEISSLGKKELEWLNKEHQKLTGNLVIYHESYISPTILKYLPKDIKIEEFKLPVILWRFLDGLYPGNSSNSVRDLHKIIELQPPEFLFSLITKLFRDLYWIKTDALGLPYSSWRVGKLKSQAYKYKLEQLKQFISKFAEIDIKVKTSKTDLIDELDLLIIKQLE